MIHDSDLPAELVRLPQWVAWKYVPDPDRPKPRKIPVTPRTGANASSTDPDTWGVFEEAAIRATASRMAGVGFVFSERDPYCGIDLDGCVSDGGRTVNDFASTLIDQMSSYTELSPSGTGVHIIVKATLPGHGLKSGAIEMYDRGRFFTVTGSPVGRPVFRIADRQSEVEKIYLDLRPKVPVRATRLPVGPEVPDDAVLDLIQATGLRKKFFSLFGGHWKKKYDSQSEADLALCGMLASFVGDNPGQIDRLFRRSNLFREKWDETRGSQTYGELTIAKILGD